MTGDPRAELADLARKVRERIAREDAAGMGELLVRAAARRAGAPAPQRAEPAAGGAKAAATTAGALRPPTAHVTVAPAPAREVPVATGSADAAPMPAHAAPAPAHTAATPAIAPATPAEVDLFGHRVVRVVPIAEEAAAAAAAPPPAFHDLNPADAEERAAIYAGSLAVLEAIAGEVRACRKCGLCDTRTKAVPGTGSARTGILFVGEAPGADEDAQGEPFVGRAGQLLTRIIQAMDEQGLIPGVRLSRETVYIGNVLKCRPPENRNPLPHEIENCSPYLVRQIEALRPRIICCLGKFAAELLVGVKGTIGGLRGRVYSYRGAKLIVTYHPAACLRNPGYKRPVWEDMQLLAREYLSD